MLGKKPNSQLLLKKQRIKKFVPFSILLSGLIVFWFLNVNKFISYEWLTENQIELTNWIADNDFLASVVYVLVYIVIVSCSMPVGTAMTIAGGFFFGPVLGASLSVIGATGGAAIAFLAARFAFEPLSKKRFVTPIISQMRDGFERNAFGYMLFLRLIPIFPFFMVNLVPAFLGIKLMIFIVSTFLGIIPGTLIYSYLGGGLSSVLLRWEDVDQNIIFTPLFLFPLIGLGVLVLTPIIYKKWKRFRERES